MTGAVAASSQAGRSGSGIHAAGLCHSDLSAINGDRPWPVPIVPGHEAAAEVQDKYLARDYDGAAAAVPFEFIDSTSLIGPPERVQERLHALAEAGVTTLSVATYAAVYYALWATADVLIQVLDLDVGWALRVIPNQLYYAFYVPFAYLRYFASGADQDSASTAAHASR